jgi:hypothetical protein
MLFILCEKSIKVPLFLLRCRAQSREQILASRLQAIHVPKLSEMIAGFSVSSFSSTHFYSFLCPAFCFPSTWLNSDAFVSHLADPGSSLAWWFPDLDGTFRSFLQIVQKNCSHHCLFHHFTIEILPAVNVSFMLYSDLNAMPHSVFIHLDRIFNKLAYCFV